MGNIEIALKYPIKVDGEEVSTIKLRRPRVRDLKATDEAVGNVARMVALIASVAEIPPSSVEQMDVSDFEACAGNLSDFFGVSLPTGGT